MSFLAVYVLWGATFYAMEGGRCSVSAIAAGGDEAFFGRTNVISDVAMENGNSAHGGTVEDCGNHRFTAALHRKRRSVLG